MKIEKPNFIAFKNKELADKYVADLLINEINKSKKINLGLATGSTPEGIYLELVKNYKKNKVSFSKVSTFNLDEYLGLKKKYFKKSYRFFMDNILFSKIDIDRKKTFFPHEWDSLELKEEYFEYDDLIAKKGGIDIQILGIGENGHIAFNEPGSLLKGKTSKVNLVESTIKANSRFFEKIEDVPTNAISMGLDTILKAKKIILIAYGEKKVDAIKSLYSNTSFNIEWPCTSLLLHPDVTIVTDFINDIEIK